MMLRADTAWPRAGGGVCGSVRLNAASARLAMAAEYSGMAVCSG